MPNNIDTLYIHFQFAWISIFLTDQLEYTPNLQSESGQHVLSTSTWSPSTELSLRGFLCQEMGPATNFKSQSEMESFLFSTTLWT